MIHSFMTLTQTPLTYLTHWLTVSQSDLIEHNLTHSLDMTAWLPDTWYCLHSHDSTNQLTAMHFLFFYSDLGKQMAKDLMLPMISGLAF